MCEVAGTYYRECTRATLLPYPFLHVLLYRNIESGIYEDQPNTPSKSKMVPRRPFLVYITMLAALFLIGILLVRPDVVNNGEQYTARKTSPRRSRDIENSEARQREALEIADTLHDNMPLDSLGQLSGGGGNFPSISVDTAPGYQDSVVSSEPLLTPDEIRKSSELADKAHEVVSEDPSAKQAAIAAAVERPEIVIVSQPLVKGGSRDIKVDKTRWNFLESLSNGLESEELEGLEGLSSDESWWVSNHSTGLLSWEVRRAITRDSAPKPISINDDIDESCKIHVLDVNKDVGPAVGARNCNLGFKRVWPFARHNWGIDGVDTLNPENYQYASEYWLSQAIKNSSMYEKDPAKADLVFVDMYCYHLAWLAYVHPLGNRNTTDPEPYMRKTLDKIVKSERFVKSKGGDFVFVHPSPIMKGLFKEEAMCEDLASAFHLVPERSSLCVWTPDAASKGSSLIMPYVSNLDLDFDSDLERTERDLLIYFRGGCGHPHPSVRGLFAAGKMLRYEFVHSIKTARQENDIDIQCSCDICDNHTPHQEVMQGYRRARFCPVLPSNVQSSRRLSEVILSGCIPVFIGPPFHTLPLQLDVDYKSMGIFINITNSSWIDYSSPHHLQNKLVSHLWPLDDYSLEDCLIPLDDLHEVVDYLRNISPEEEAQKRRSLLKQRFKFYFGAVPRAAGGDDRTSELGQIAMKHMCKHASEEKRKMQLSKSQGISNDNEALQKKGNSLMKDRGSLTNDIWSFIKTTVH